MYTIFKTIGRISGNLLVFYLLSINITLNYVNSFARIYFHLGKYVSIRTLNLLN